MGNSILVLGASGFIGKYISQQIDSIPITRKEADLTDWKSVKNLITKYKPHTIINAASDPDTSLTNFNKKAYLNNISIFNNLYILKEDVGQVINLGSGAEFDRRFDIYNVDESEIFFRNPIDHYGFSKNINARTTMFIDNFYTLRLFGCFHHTENSRRLLKNVLINKYVEVGDRYFDFFWLEDIIPVLDYYFSNQNKPKDLNLVYKDKILLSEFIGRFFEYKGLNKKIIYKSVNLNYTGSCEKLYSLGLNLQGLDKGLKEYKI